MATPNLLRVVEREARVFRRLWRGTAFSALVTPLLFLAAMGVGLGGLIDERSGAVDGVKYLVFVTPGLLAGSAMQTGAGAGLWQVMAGMKWIRSYHAMAASPLTPGDVLLGYLTWNAVRIGIYASGFLAVAAVLGGVPSPWAVLAVPAAMLTGSAFTAPLCAFSATQETDQAFSVIMRLVVMPLFLFSGTFFPVEELPDGLEPLVAISPLWHGVELCRAATTGHAALDAVAVHVAVLATLVALGVHLGRRTYAGKLTP